MRRECIDGLSCLLKNEGHGLPSLVRTGKMPVPHRPRRHLRQPVRIVDPWMWRVFLVAVIALMEVQAYAQWPQWGGPARDFSIHAAPLADSWPEDGPPRLWVRTLGDGFSSVVVEEGVLYTMYREEKNYEREHVVALNAATGETIWDSDGPSIVPKDELLFPGPHSTPLISGESLFTVGRCAVLRCYEKKTGKVRWTHDLVAEFGAAIPPWGYASSPISFECTVIVLMGTQPYDARARLD